MNKVFLVGRLVEDPKPFTTQKGTAQSRITIATQDNRVKTESYFFPCIAWQNSANFINTYLKKGDLVAIDGKLTRRSFTSKDGKTAYVTEIVIDAINSIGSKKDNQAVVTKSIDQAFPENIVNQSSPIEKVKQEPIASTGEVDWVDETINKE